MTLKALRVIDGQVEATGVSSARSTRSESTKRLGPSYSGSNAAPPAQVAGVERALTASWRQYGRSSTKRLINVCRQARNGQTYVDDLRLDGLLHGVHLDLGFSPAELRACRSFCHEAKNG
jgi:hypothetical protein